MDYAKKLSSFLCKNHKKKYCLIVGNATTAIYLALISNKNVKYVGIPNNSCIHLPIELNLQIVCLYFWILIKITTG